MKRFSQISVGWILCFSFVSGISGFVHASEGPLLRKTLIQSVVLMGDNDESARANRLEAVCDIYKDAVVITSYVGEIVTTKTERISFGDSDIYGMIAAASRGEIRERPITPLIPPRESYVGFFRGKEFWLKAIYGRNIRNLAPEANTLISLLDVYCP